MVPALAAERTSLSSCYICSKTESKYLFPPDDTLCKICIACQRLFCAKHAAAPDDDLCSECGSPSALAAEIKPLIDDEGVEHKNGQHIVPQLTQVGNFYVTTPGYIAKISDDKLEALIAEMRRKVREAEAMTNTRRVILSTAELEKEERGRDRLRRLRSEKVASPSTKSVAGKAIPASPDAMAAAIGLTKVQLIALLAQAKANIAAKKKGG